MEGGGLDDRARRDKDDDLQDAIEDRPQGPIKTEYVRDQKYADDRLWPKLIQWFVPLPNKQEVRSRRDIRKDMGTTTMSPEVAEHLLEEARGLMARRDEQIASAEAKATTLLGTVAISGSLIIASAGLMLDSSKIDGCERKLLAVIVALLLFFLLMCGWTASRALLHVLQVSRPRIDYAIRRAALNDIVTSRRELAIDLMTRAGFNVYPANYKLAQVRIAYRWYRLALAAFAALALFVTLYGLLG